MKERVRVCTGEFFDGESIELDEDGYNFIKSNGEKIYINPRFVVFVEPLVI